MDGTLLDSEKLWDVAVRELSVQLGGVMTDETRHALVGSAGPAALQIIFASVGREPTPAALTTATAWLENRVTELFARGIDWRPGAATALATVRAAGLRTALVTNTQRRLTEVALDTLDRAHFDVTVCGDEVVRSKPAPDPYRRAAELLDVPIGNCLAIEDSPTGVAAAEAAGCAVLAVPSEIAVPTGPGRTVRTSLRGLQLADLQRAYTS